MKKLILALSVFLCVNNVYSSGLPDEKNNNTAMGRSTVPVDRASFDTLANYMVPVKEGRVTALIVYLKSPVKEELKDRNGNVTQVLDIDQYSVAPSIVDSFLRKINFEATYEKFGENMEGLNRYREERDYNFYLTLDKLLELANSHKLFTRYEVEQKQKLESENQGLTKKVAEQSQQIQDLEAYLNNQRASTQTELSQAENKIQELSSLLASRDAEIEMLRQQLASKESDEQKSKYKYVNPEGK